METNHSSVIGNFDEQMMGSSSPSDDQVQWSSSNVPVRTYTCSFCKKGFSNAQALGGHMNIHRKDRAKLREAFDDENLLSLNSMNNIPVDQLHDDQASLDSTEVGSCMPKTQYTLSMDDGASIAPANKEDMKIDRSLDGEEEKRRQLIHGSTQMELDLELRLGPEPLETSSSSWTRSTSTSTREFF